MPALNIFDYGDRVDLGYTLANASGIPVNGTVTATAVNGSGIASAMTVANTATGVYGVGLNLDVDAPGRWRVDWRATGAVIDAETVTIMVRPRAPVRADTAYANVDDVLRYTQGRTFTASSKPNVSDVQDFLAFTAAEIDGILRAGGYALPVTATSALSALADGNALGAACRVETAAPVGREGQVCRLWQSFKKMLREGEIELDASRDGSQSSPRSNAINQATAMFDVAYYGTLSFDR
ncbi:MAG: hypothetical protein LC798_21250 [Chloroflexi bacterium]|nr:hypothetical protein [Chloroflexota bacterium]